MMPKMEPLTIKIRLWCELGGPDDPPNTIAVRIQMGDDAKATIDHVPESVGLEAANIGLTSAIIEAFKPKPGE